MKEQKSLFQEWKTKSLSKVIIGRLRRWWTSASTPNSWPDELEDAVYAPDAIPICRHCLTPCAHHVWFCPNCGASFGPYNNYMPYVYILSIGEALRTGVGPKARFTPFLKVAYFFVGLAQYYILVPWYFIRLYLNYGKLKKEKTEQSDITAD